jgi:hypothetical protein
VSVRIRPSAPRIKNLTGLQQESMGIVDVNAGLCSSSTEDSAYANKSELLDQPVRYIADRREIGEKKENKLDIILQGELSVNE